MYKEFENFDRFAFPKGVSRVTAGQGGEAILIHGSEYTALVDTGMAYCHEGLIKNIEEVLEKEGKSGLDYIFISHTHYDHVGAMPYLRDRWPNVKVCGAEKARDVFTRPGALKVIKSLGDSAERLYKGTDEGVRVDGLFVNVVLEHNQIVSLGEWSIRALATKGHTDCSLTFVLQPYELMFASESTGALEPGPVLHTAILKSYKDSLEALEICRSYGAKQLVSPHYGMIPSSFIDNYWKMFEEEATEKKAYILGLRDKGLTEENIIEKLTNVEWGEQRASLQPKEAFVANATALIKAVLKEFPSR